MEVFILLGLVMMMLNKPKSRMLPIAEIMPEVLPVDMLLTPEVVLQQPEDLPVGTLVGPSGEGIRFQQEGEIVAALASVSAENSRSAGSMKFRMRFINLSDDWFRFRYLNVGKAFTRHFELVIISPFMQQGHTPDWFKTVVADAISKVNSDVSKVWRIIDGKIPNPTPRELSVDAIDSGSIPIIRYIKSRKTSTSQGIVTCPAR